MATVTSYTKERIAELMAGWEGVSVSQEAIHQAILTIKAELEAQNVDLTEFKQVILPQLEAELAAGSVAVSELNDTTLPNLEQELNDHNAQLEELNTVTLPNLSADLYSGIENSLIRPQVFFADEPPTDTEDRALQVSDVWYDTSQGHKQYMWNGVEWSPFTVDIPDLSLTVRKFNTSTHMIY